MSKKQTKKGSLEVQRLEDRTVPAVAASLSAGVLRITGTESADTVVLRQTGYQRVTVSEYGQATKTFTGVQQIYADARGGNDYIYFDTTPLGAYENSWAVRATLLGGTGNDTLVGGAAGDYIDGGTGDDALYGNSGNDTITAGYGNDLVSAGLGNDQVYGDSGNDRLYGGTGNDQVYGGGDQDYIDGGHGLDTLAGGTGFDTYHNLYANGDAVTESDPEDVRQGLGGTCVILSSLQAVSGTGVDLAGRITKVGTNQYAVPMFRPGAGWVNQIVYYDGTWTDNDPAPTADGNAWVLLYQRAYLQECGVNWADTNASAWASRYGSTFQNVDRAFIALTGHSTWNGAVNGSVTDSQLAAMRSNFAQHRAQIVLSRPSNSAAAADMTRLGIVTSHAYSVEGFGYTSTGEVTVTLRNPWGTDGPKAYGANDGIITLKWSDFRKVMLGYCVS